MSEAKSLSDKQKRATFGVVFLTIFMDMVGFSVIFPLFPSMLDHYLTREASMGGGLVTSFVEMVKGYGFEGVDGEGFRLETVIFGGALGSLYAILQFVFAPIWGRFSDRMGRRPVLLLTLGGTCLGYGLWIFAGSFWILVLFSDHWWYCQRKFIRGHSLNCRCYIKKRPLKGDGHRWHRLWSRIRAGSGTWWICQFMGLVG
jgi:hypothetical protein